MSCVGFLLGSQLAAKARRGLLLRQPLDVHAVVLSLHLQRKLHHSADAAVVALTHCSFLETQVIRTDIKLTSFHSV